MNGLEGAIIRFLSETMAKMERDVGKGGKVPLTAIFFHNDGLKWGEFSPFSRLHNKKFHTFGR